METTANSSGSSSAVVWQHAAMATWRSGRRRADGGAACGRRQTWGKDAMGTFLGLEVYIREVFWAGLASHGPRFKKAEKFDR